MMKVIVILGSNLQVSPYAYLYFQALRNNNFTIDLAYWNRTGQKLPDNVSFLNAVYEYKKSVNNDSSKLKKILPFLGFRKFLQNVLKQNLYDFAIVLDTQFGVLIIKTLIKRYKNKYIYDMRDLSYEDIPLYRKLMNKLAKFSAGTFVSSDGFRQFFDEQNKIYSLHNFQNEDLLNTMVFNKKKDGVLNISFWGCLRDVEINKKLISKLANDSRFSISYHGVLSDTMTQLKNYCESNNFRNVVFTGSYNQHERYIFAKKTDILINLFENFFHKTNPIMSNKYYDGSIFGIPQIVMKSSFMAEIVEKNGIGLALDVDTFVSDDIYNYYMRIDEDCFRKNCQKSNEWFIKEHNASVNKINEILKNV